MSLINLDHKGYDTDCLNDVEFHQLHLYHYHIKFYDRSVERIRSEIWEGSDREQVLESFNNFLLIDLFKITAAA